MRQVVFALACLAALCPAAEQEAGAVAGIGPLLTTGGSAWANLTPPGSPTLWLRADKGVSGIGTGSLTWTDRIGSYVFSGGTSESSEITVSTIGSVTALQWANTNSANEGLCDSSINMNTFLGTGAWTIAAAFQNPDTTANTIFADSSVQDRGLKASLSGSTVYVNAYQEYAYFVSACSQPGNCSGNDYQCTTTCSVSNCSLIHAVTCYPSCFDGNCCNESNYGSGCYWYEGAGCSGLLTQCGGYSYSQYSVNSSVSGASTMHYALAAWDGSSLYSCTDNAGCVSTSAPNSPGLNNHPCVGPLNSGSASNYKIGEVVAYSSFETQSAFYSYFQKKYGVSY